MAINGVTTTVASNMLIKLFVKGASYFRGKRRDDKAFFSEVITPIYQQLDAVSKEYFAIFEDARQYLIEDEQHDTAKWRRRLSTQRNRNQRSRRKVEGFAEGLYKSIKSADTREFVEGIRKFFKAPDSYVALGEFSKALVLVNLFAKLEQESSSKQEIERYIELATQEMEAALRDVASAYKQLEITWKR